LVQPGNAELIVAAIPDARLAWIEGAGHVFWTDATDSAIALVNDFLADRRPADLRLADPPEEGVSGA
jgi:pimeloyl-ACP methyl ester carboxylesterase